MVLVAYNVEFVINETKNGTKIRNVTCETEQNVSYKKVFDNSRLYHSQRHSVKGYLYYEYSYDMDKEIGTYTPYVVDDFNRCMGLDRLNSSQRSLFIKRNKTEQIYNVSGVILRTYPGFRIEVSSIEPTEPDMIEKIRKEPYNDETIIIERKVGMWERLNHLMTNV